MPSPVRGVYRCAAGPVTGSAGFVGGVLTSSVVLVGGGFTSSPALAGGGLSALAALAGGMFSCGLACVGRGLSCCVLSANGGVGPLLEQPASRQAVTMPAHTLTRIRFVFICPQSSTAAACLSSRPSWDGHRHYKRITGCCPLRPGR